MTDIPSTSGSVFRLLCRVLGGQDPTVLEECVAARMLPQLFDMALLQDVLPALAVRCNENNIDTLALGAERADLLKQALMDNTLRNMNISAQALKIARQLNRAGITPLFLKGTARLLMAEEAHIGFRKQVDIDLIVRHAELEAAGDVFLSSGYVYLETSGNASVVPTTSCDTLSAIKSSKAHHHLPPLAKTGYAATVELHRHFLDKRFQRANPLQPLFSSARQIESHGASFSVPSTEYQLIHLILGKLVTDGHLARRSFPIREACDLMDLLENAAEGIDTPLVLQHCGSKFELFCGLVSELMAYTPRIMMTEPVDTSKFIRLMQKRFDSAAVSRLLDTYARAVYLTSALAYSPAKLPAYLRRLLSTQSS